MSWTRFYGGLLSLVAGSLKLVAVLRLSYTVIYWIWEDMGIQWTINLLIASIVIIGSLYGLLGKKWGGYLVIVLGSLAIAFNLLYTVNVMQFSMFAQYSILEFLGYFHYITLEPIIMIIGGVLILLSHHFFPKMGEGSRDDKGY